MKRQKYERSFRDEAVRLAITGEGSIAKTAKNLGINEGTLYNWVSDAKKSGAEIRTAGKETLVEELLKLKRENARLKEEREILKKAAKFFAEESK